MKEQFKKFSSNIRLTSVQEQDAETKYKGVCKKLHDFYYDIQYNGTTKLLFGSYKTKTNVRPIVADQDVDVLFKVTTDTFEKFDNHKNNGQSALLQEVKLILNEKYTTTDKISAWGKVVLVEFSDRHHNIEVLPAYEKDNGTFLIPNSENGGFWETFDPRSQIKEFQNRNQISNGLVAELARMVKAWIKNTPSLKYKSFQVVNDTITFLKTDFITGANFDQYHLVVKNFLDFLKRNCGADIKNHAETAFNRTVKAIEFMDDNKPKEASEQWIRIFGDQFPKVNTNPKINGEKSRTFVTASAPWRK